MKKILCTGGAGYLGSILVETLLGHHEVTVLDNFMHKENSLAHLCHVGHLEIVRGDARSSRLLMELVPKADIIIPLAALVGAPLCDEDRVGAHSINFSAIRLLCEFSSKNQAIIIPTTNSGYGIGEPGKECTEASPLEPISFYGKTKVCAEELIMERGNSVSLRLATLFGMSPRMRLDLLVNNFVHRAVHDRFIVLYEASAKRNYLHVRDAARAFVHVINNWEKLKDNIFNVGLSNANLSKRELCEKIKEHIRIAGAETKASFTVLEAPVGTDPDKRDYIVSNAKIEAAGWKPRFSLNDGIRELIKGYQMIRENRYANV
jgi:nucleoside-diphosphate-sugar epimerase